MLQAVPTLEALAGLRSSRSLSRPGTGGSAHSRSSKHRARRALAARASLMKALAAQHTAVLAQREAEKALERAKRDSIAADVADDVAGAAGAAAGAFAAAGSAAGALLEVPTIEVPDFLAGW